MIFDRDVTQEWLIGLEQGIAFINQLGTSEYC